MREEIKTVQQIEQEAKAAGLVRLTTLKRISLAVVYVITAGVMIASGQQNQRVLAASVINPRALEQAQVEAAQRAISEATIMIKGKAFPKRSEEPGAKVQGQGFCQPYDTRQETKRAEIIDRWAPGTWGNRPSDTHPHQIAYSPSPSIWVISSYQRVENFSTGSVDVSVESYPGNFHLLTSGQFESVYNANRNYVLNLNIADKVKADLTIKLDNYVKSYSSYSKEITASHGTVTHTANLHGMGLGKGGTYYNAWLDVTEVCAPAEVTDSQALDQKLKAFVNGVVKSLPTGGTLRFDPNLSVK